MSADTGSVNTKLVAVPLEVPREPEAYRATTHFGQRLRERVPEELRDRLVRDLIEGGTLRGTTDPRNDGKDDVHQYFAFEDRVNGRDWRLVVGVVPAAFIEPTRKHLAVTIIDVGGDSDE